MAVAMLIALWIYDEVSFDRQGPHSDRIARVAQNVTNNNEVETWMQVPFPLGHKKINEHGGYLEPGAPEMFGARMVRGSLNGLDDQPGSIFLSESMAKAFFGAADPMGQNLEIDTSVVKVAGVYEDFPRNSSFSELKFMSTWGFFYNRATWLRTIEDPWRPNFISDESLAFVQRIQKRRECGRGDPICMDVRDDRRICIAVSLYQLYEPEHGAKREAGSGGGYPQDVGLAATAVGDPVL
jgi:hypothetical protein